MQRLHSNRLSTSYSYAFEQNYKRGKSVPSISLAQTLEAAAI